MLGHLNPDLHLAMWEQGIKQAAARFPAPEARKDSER